MSSQEQNPIEKLTPQDIPQPQGFSEENTTHIDQIQKELNDFAETNGLRSLSDRIKRGLDPVGIVALQETNSKIHELADKFQVSYEEVLNMVTEVQTGGPWKYANQMKEATEPAVKIWMIMNTANTAGKEREMDMTPEEFLKDIERIKKLLDNANQNPESFFAQAKEQVLQKSMERFRIENEVPISEMDNGFIAMATNGYEAGIIQDADGLLFVGAKEINSGIFEKWQLKQEIREDRGKDVTFYVNNKGEAVAKQLYPGFVIVLSRNFELAKAIVEASQSKARLKELNADVLGHMVYTPTSFQGKTFEDFVGGAEIKKSKRVQETTVQDENVEGNLRSNFYNKLAYLKSNQIFRDRAIALIQRKREKRHGRVTREELQNLAEQTQNKVSQKMEELEYMMLILGPYLDTVTSDKKIVDMAGGAGDLGLATTVELLARNKKPTETEIVDPVEEVAVFNKLLVNELDLPPDVKLLVHSKVETLQEAGITPESIVVAKHACGTLTDEIIEKWVQSESPILCIMTCCQDKAKDQPARYNLPQEEWQTLCKDSAKTNNQDPKKQMEGMVAMTKLDNARVAYLRRYGFEAELVQTDKFPKGDVIIASRRKIENSK